MGDWGGVKEEERGGGGMEGGKVSRKKEGKREQKRWNIINKE